MKDFRIRAQSWSGVWIGILALVAGAVLLWFALALAVVFAILAVFVLALSRARRLWTRKRTDRVPVTIEGHYTKGNE